MSAVVEVRFVTKLEEYAVPGNAFSVPSNVGCKELNALINEILRGSAIEQHEDVEFDFLINGKVLRVPLSEHFQEHSITSESIVDVEYFLRVTAPEPRDCLLHDDWVSAVETKGNWILSGCYDNTLHLWTRAGVHYMTIPGHTAAVKAVAWVTISDDTATFVSVSQDQTVMLWEWRVSSNAVECVHVCRGHERELECVGVSPCHTKMATGGWDTKLKIWSADVHETSDTVGESVPKRKRTELGNSQTRVPLMTLKGHKEAISAVQWTDSAEICTSSWDHTLRMWDVEIGGIKTELVGNKAFFDAHYSPLNKTLITASADKYVRLYDPRSKEGSLVKSTFSSHSEWVQSVRWSGTEEHLFVSGANDQMVKLWDSRSSKAPLYDLRGHDGHVLCCDWSDPELIVSGGADNTLRIFSSNQSANK